MYDTINDDGNYYMPIVPETMLESSRYQPAIDNKTKFILSEDGLMIRSHIPGYACMFKEVTIPKYVFENTIKAYLPELIKSDPDIRNMITNIIRQEVRKSR